MATVGKIVLDLPPKEGNPRNSEGAFLNLKDGRLMLVYSKFNADSDSDVAPAVIAARYSQDGGLTWDSEDRILFHAEQFDTPQKPCQNIMSVSLLRMQDGALGLFFGLRYDFLDTHMYLFRSYDEGETFDEGVRSIPAEGYYVTNNDRIIRTKSGRIIVPGNFHRVKGSLEDQYNYHNAFDYRAIVTFSLSDDDGKTWREASDVCYPPFTNSNSGLQETGLVELASGVLWAYSRTDMGCQYFCYSMDDGEHWTTPMPSQFTSPVSPMSVKRTKDGKALVAVWNPAPAYQTREESCRQFPATSYGHNQNPEIWSCSGYNFARTPLVVAVSKDEGATWSNAYFAEDGPGGYCYVAIHCEEEHILLQYCAGQLEDKGCLNRLRVRAIPLSELGL